MDDRRTWRRLDAEWTDDNRLARIEEGWQFSGRIESGGGTDWFRPPFRASYAVDLTLDWRTVRLQVELALTNREVIPALDLRPDGAGRWSNAGALVPGLTGATDVDLFLTPATNTIPIRRLSPAVGTTTEIVAALVSFDEDRWAWEFDAQAQRYTRLADDRYRFVSLDPDRTEIFTADVIVDPAGIVRRYGDHWQLVASPS